MGKLRRGNFIFVTWKGDHGHAMSTSTNDGKLVVKWNLDDRVPMKGHATARVLQLIAELEQEGSL